MLFPMRQDSTTDLVYEYRQEPRKKALIHAFVSDRADITDLKCVIRDISKSGCRIASSYIEHLPRIIEIFPVGFDKPLTGKIIWRNSKVAGIEFLSAAEVAAYDREKAKPKAEPKPVKPAGFFSRLQSFASLYRFAGRGKRAENAAQERKREFGVRVLRGLRNPLAALKNLLNLLLGDSIRPIPKRAKSVLRAAQQNAKKAETLVEEGLHSFGRLVLADFAVAIGIELHQVERATCSAATASLAVRGAAGPSVAIGQTPKWGEEPILLCKIFW